MKTIKTVDTSLQSVVASFLIVKIFGINKRKAFTTIKLMNTFNHFELVPGVHNTSWGA